MRKILIVFIYSILSSFMFFLSAQDKLEADSSIIEINKVKLIENNINKDTLKPLISDKKIILHDSIILNEVKFKPNPTKAIIYSAILPGLGQYYNKKYWKIPLVIGGALGLTYSISWNGARYGEYKDAYMDFVLNPSGTIEAETWTNYIPRGSNPKDYIDNPSDKTWLETRLKKRKDFFRRNRDLAIIATVGVYALCIIDAYVDAHLYDFDMSPDLSMRIEPVFWGNSQYSSAAIGLQCSITF